MLEEEVLEVPRRVFGAEHPDTLTAMSNLVCILVSQGDSVAAGAIQREVVDACQRVLGQEHPDTLTATEMLAQISEVERSG